jgi:hypothetical protein
MTDAVVDRHGTKPAQKETVLSEALMAHAGMAVLSHSSRTGMSTGIGLRFANTAGSSLRQRTATVKDGFGERR